MGWGVTYGFAPTVRPRDLGGRPRRLRFRPSPWPLWSETRGDRGSGKALGSAGPLCPHRRPSPPSAEGRGAREAEPDTRHFHPSLWPQAIPASSFRGRTVGDGGRSGQRTLAALTTPSSQRVQKHQFRFVAGTPARLDALFIHDAPDECGRDDVASRTDDWHAVYNGPPLRAVALCVVRGRCAIQAFVPRERCSSRPACLDGSCRYLDRLRGPDVEAIKVLHYEPADSGPLKVSLFYGSLGTERLLTRAARFGRGPRGDSYLFYGSLGTERLLKRLGVGPERYFCAS